MGGTQRREQLSPCLLEAGRVGGTFVHMNNPVTGGVQRQGSDRSGDHDHPRNPARTISFTESWTGSRRSCSIEGSRRVVLFRPFHEMNGSWFWWGDWKPSQSRLWRDTFDYLTRTKALDNLLWCTARMREAGTTPATIPDRSTSTSSDWTSTPIRARLQGSLGLGRDELAREAFAITEFGAFGPSQSDRTEHDWTHSRVHEELVPQATYSWRGQTAGH